MATSKARSVALAGRSTLYFDVRRGDKLLEENTKNHSAANTGARPSPGRLLGIDWGAKQIGLALSDEIGISARPLPHLERRSWKKTVKLLAEVCDDYGVRGVVLGLPLRLDGTEGAAAQEIRRVARNLSLTLNLQVYLQDERLTSLETEGLLKAEGLTGSTLHEHVHSRAAALILEDFLANSHQQSTA